MMSNTNKQDILTTKREATDPLQAVEPIGKSRRFRLLLPVITAKIERGVEHAEIMKALAEQGLTLTQGTYFSYLKRYRSAEAAKPTDKSAAAPRGEIPKPPTPQVRSGADVGTAGRPKTFDYDPRGIDPDLLK